MLLIAKENYVKAYWYTLRALEYAPKSHRNINNMAVIYRRMNNDERAEEIYKYGISISDEKLTLLKNYRVLLEAQGRMDEATGISKRINSMNDPSPYNWINIADKSLKDGAFDEAENYYKKAIKLAPYLQYAYLGLAKTYYSEARFDEAEEMLLLAMENNYNRSNRVMYKAKLATLRSEKHLKLELLDW